MKFYVIAGEASGDLHGSNLIKHLQEQQPDAEFRVWGGDLMQAAGGTLVKHYRDLAFMGFVEVAKNLRTILGNIAFCQRDIIAYQPDALILIDYPGFNLRIAKWARRKGLRVIYYISPQIWAWHQSRVHDIRRDVDKMIVILPFEQDFYAKYGVQVEYVGHPLLDTLTAAPPIMDKATSSPLVALMPGSRKQELQRIFPRMLEVTRHFPDHDFAVLAAPSVPDSFFEPILAHYPNVRVERGRNHDILRQAQAALIKSGTSTLETALIGTPQVVCYAGNRLSYLIARRLVTVRYISLVNLILDKPAVQELIQDELNVQSLRSALSELLNPDKAATIRADYAELRHLLGGGGASARAAQVVLEAMRTSVTNA
jgi:lipid-A-disaccharide synthase